MKTILTLDKANQPFGFPQLNSGGTFDNVIATNITGTTISAATYLNLPNQNYIADTYANLTTLRSNSGLTPGVLYKITDRSDNLGIFINAVSTSEFSREGYRFMYVPLTYESTSLSGFTWLGVWYSGLTPSVGDLCIWGARVWENVNGNSGSELDEITLDAEWLEQVVTTPIVYKIRGFLITYDFDDDWILSQTDGSNIIGGLVQSKWNSVYGFAWNPCDRTDWNMTQSPSHSFYNNKSVYILNNRVNEIVGNSCLTIYGNYSYAISYNISNDIYNNYIDSASIYNNECVYIYENDLENDIALNKVRTINNNSNNGAIDNNFGDSINNNINDGHISENIIFLIQNNSNAGVIQKNKGHQIINNTNSGEISNNLSNADITNQTSSTTSIIDNIFNGDLDTSITGPISGLCCTSSIITTGITSSAATLNLYTNYYGVNFNGNVDLTLPNPTGKDGYELHIKDEGGYAGTTRIRLTASTGLIDGNSYVDMNINYMSLHLIARNNNWWII